MARTSPPPRELAEAIDAFPIAAYLCTASGVLLHANVAARDVHPTPPPWLERCCRRRDATGQRIRRDLHVRGRHLVLVVDAVARRVSLETRLRASRTRWGLTARQADVLRLLAVGKSNKTIASELGIAMGTVELHVSRLLARADVDARSELVAKFWTELV